MHPDQRFISYLQSNYNQGITEIYTLYAPKIARMIQYNRGDPADAADIMQEALMDICRMSADGKFKLTCPFEAFLVMVCKRKWLNVLKKKSGSPVTKSIDDGFTIDKSDEEAAELHVQQLEREHTVMRSEEHTSELQSLMRISYAVFCLKKKTK